MTPEIRLLMNAVKVIERIRNGGNPTAEELQEASLGLITLRRMLEEKDKK